MIRHLRLRVRRTAFLFTAIVVLGLWNAQTDYYPLNEQQARPEYYAYGWPICFCVSSRGRFNFVGFSGTALAFDSTISLAMVACTVYVGQALGKRFPIMTLKDMFAILTSSAVAVAVLSGRMNWLYRQVLGAEIPKPGYAEALGDVQHTSWFITVPIGLGLASIGYVLFDFSMHSWFLFTHPKSANPITISGKLGADAKKYQERIEECAKEESKD